MQRSTIITILSATVFALVVIVIIVAGGGSKSAGEVKSGSGDEVAALLAGIPQEGNTLGSPTAPVTMVEYADLKCPVCKQYTADILPKLIEQYVKPGKLKIQFQPQTFVGGKTSPGDSERAARMLLAAGQQNKLWDFSELFYQNQKNESVTYVTDDYLKALSTQIKGLDVDKALNDRAGQTVTQALSMADQEFTQAGFTGTPSFKLGKTGGQLAPLNVASLDISAFTPAIDQLLK